MFNGTEAAPTIFSSELKICYVSTKSRHSFLNEISRIRYAGFADVEELAVTVARSGLAVVTLYLIVGPTRPDPVSIKAFVFIFASQRC